jgi:hypothetical protein
MKQSDKLTIAMSVIFILIGVVVYLMNNKQPVAKVPKPYPELVEMPSPSEPMEIHIPYMGAPPRKEPEFRQPPVKKYKPGHVQQMGVLLGEDGETLPLYGKEVRGRRDRYHYYTSTPGQQIYSIPVSCDNRDCMDDMGCQELYGQEKVSVLGKTTPYEAKLYRTENFFI